MGLRRGKLFARFAIIISQTPSPIQHETLASIEDLQLRRQQRRSHHYTSPSYIECRVRVFFLCSPVFSCSPLIGIVAGRIAVLFRSQSQSLASHSISVSIARCCVAKIPVWLSVNWLRARVCVSVSRKNHTPRLFSHALHLLFLRKTTHRRQEAYFHPNAHTEFVSV